ncbi:MAG: hypothetical protein JXR80_12170, partial [Deltaproteobacteria bacterium]|nr:hypothetical protein [Deltaproteobacteria bacterium]
PCEKTSLGTNSGWIANTHWNNWGLTFGTAFSYRVMARNHNSITTAWVSLGSQATLSCSGTPCPADFDNDKDVDVADLVVFIADFGRTDCAVGSPCEGDFDSDADVDGVDLAEFLSEYGRQDCQ